MSPVVFYYSIGSRYSYLASTQLERIRTETGCTFDWRPVASLRLIARRPDDPFARPDRTGQYAPAYRDLDLARWARLYGIAYVEPTDRVEFDPETLSLACTAARRLGAVEAVSHGLYAAMYEGHVDRIDADRCVAVAVRAGLDGERFRREMTSPDTCSALDRAVDEAATAGVFGVPTFVVGGESFFGNDRLVLLREHLLGGGAGGSAT